MSHVIDYTGHQFIVIEVPTSCYDQFEFFHLSPLS